MERHTEGKLEYSEERPNCLLSGLRIMGTAAYEADARRLVATWNAFNGVPQPHIEQLASDGNVMSIVAHREQLRQERDELVKVLRNFVAWNAKYPSSRTYSHYQIGPITKELDEINAEALTILSRYPEQP